MHPKLLELMQAINASEANARHGMTAQSSGEDVVLSRAGMAIGTWCLHGGRFEYRSDKQGADSRYRAYWLEKAIALTSSLGMEDTDGTMTGPALQP